jgi:hypothetical protein
MGQMNKNKHDLAEYLEEIQLTLSQDYLQIQKRVKEDPGTAGDQAEETWAGVLRRWLPQHFHVVTKGRIIGSSGAASNQIDVIVLWPNYPPFMLEKKLYIASGVAAAFEVKLTLKLQHIRKAFETAIQLSEITEDEHFKRKNSKRQKGENFAYEEYHRMFEYGILSHSFEVSDSEKAMDTITTKIRSLDAELVHHPKQMIDLVCVHGLGSWVSERNAIAEVIVNTPGGRNVVESRYIKNPVTNYVAHAKSNWGKNSSIYENFSPLGAFLAQLYTKLARTDVSLLPLAQFYTAALSTGRGGGPGSRLWSELSTPDEIWDMSAKIRAGKGSLFHEGYSFLGF